VRHYASLNPTLSFGLETSLNRYNTRMDDDVAKSGLVRMSLVQRLQEQTADQSYLALGYGFDGEYMMGDRTTRNDSFGNPYFLLPIVSREVHFLSGIYRDDWTPTTHAQLVAGYAFDRLGESGPQAEARITQDLNDNWELGARARYGLLATSDSPENDAVHFGAHLMYKF
jgi:hypothetical protein